jgi:hypothetical protein
MRRRTLRIALALAAVMVASAVAVSVAAADDRSGSRWDLACAAIATAPFHSLDRAEQAGYGPFPEGVPLHECISSLDGTGAMGFHYLNPALLTTDLDPTRHQVLAYAPDKRGRLHLVALEFVVFQADWIAAHGNTTPKLFGQTFMAAPDGNRHDIRAFFSLHVWLWRHNPSGLFAPLNPDVSCDPGRHHDGRRHHDGGGAADHVVSAAGAKFSCALVPTAST